MKNQRNLNTEWIRSGHGAGGFVRGSRWARESGEARDAYTLESIRALVLRLESVCRGRDLDELDHDVVEVKDKKVGVGTDTHGLADATRGERGVNVSPVAAAWKSEAAAP